METQLTVVGTNLEAASQLLSEDHVIGIPTETVYGLAGNALSTKAVSRIFEVKNRPTFNPLIVHVADIEQTKQYAEISNPLAIKLMETFWPGPLTLLLPKKPIIPDLVTAGSPLVAIRVPNHQLTLDLLRRLPFPLAAPSANPFMYVSPTSADHILKQLGGKIPYILDGGKAIVGLESTIIGFEEDLPVIYRVGGVPLEAIEKEVGRVLLKGSTSNHQDAENQIAPGQLSKHYATGKPSYFQDEVPSLLTSSTHKIGFLGFDQLAKSVEKLNPVSVALLSPVGDLNEAAAKLFEVMRQLDEDPEVEVIVYARFPETGLGRAINDRLSRAVTK